MDRGPWTVRRSVVAARDGRLRADVIDFTRRLEELAEYQVLYWRDIPAQIKVYENGRPRSHRLPEAFQAEIDRVAMREGLAGTEDYLNQWSWSEMRAQDGPAGEVAERVIAELVASRESR